MTVELSEAQQQLVSINRKYDRLAESLADHQMELHAVQADVTQFGDDFTHFLDWLLDAESAMNRSRSKTSAGDDGNSENAEERPVRLC